MPDLFANQLSAYLDDELRGPARARVEAHLKSCPECAALLADLRAIVSAAPLYAGREPSRDLWSKIEGRLDEPEIISIEAVRPSARPQARRFGWRELIAASIVMAGVGGGAVYLALSTGRAERGAGRLAVAPAPADSRNAAFAEQKYDSAVRDLEQLLEAGRSRLDSATVRSVEESLGKIDAAIAEARAAIQRDPANGYLNRQIAANMRRKLNLLRVATNAIAART